MARDQRTTMQRFSAWTRSARDVCGSALDDLVFAFHPEAGLKRKVMRQILTASERRISASTSDRDDDDGDRLHGSQRWGMSRLSADSELEQTFEAQRAQSAELYRDTTAGGAVDSRVDHVVGKGFTVQAKIKAQAGISEDAAKGWNDALEGVYKRWSPKCDLTGRQSLWELSRLVERSVCYAGEAFTIMWAKRRKGQPIPLVLDVIDAERVCTPPNKSGDPLCRMGVEHNAGGEITGYWVRTTHPFDNRTSEYKWDLIPADQMLHVFEKWFPGQSRGYAWMKRSLDRWRDGEDLDEAGIVAAQIEACHAAFIKTRSPNPAAQKAATVTVNGVSQQTIKPGGIHYVQNGEEQIMFSQPTKSNIVGTLHEWNHRRIAAGMNWAYEFLMKDWRGISFAGGRLVLNGVKITCQCEQQLLIVAWFVDIWNEVVREAVLFGAVEVNVSAYQQRPWIYEAHQWSAPAWSYSITPGEEVEADIKAVEHNFKTLEQVAGERQGDMEDILEQRQREVQLEKRMGVQPSDRIAAQAQQGQTADKANDDSPQKKEIEDVA